MWATNASRQPKWDVNETMETLQSSCRGHSSTVRQTDNQVNFPDMYQPTDMSTILLGSHPTPQERQWKILSQGIPLEKEGLCNTAYRQQRCMGQRTESCLRGTGVNVWSTRLNGSTEEGRAAAHVVRGLVDCGEVPQSQGRLRVCGKGALLTIKPQRRVHHQHLKGTKLGHCGRKM
jgi:hypothetical protein